MISRVGLDQVGQYRIVDDVKSSINKKTQEITNSYDDLDAFFDEDNKSKDSKKQPKSVKNGIANVWKFLSVTNQMVASAIKGAIYGAITGAAFLGGSWLFKSLPKTFSKEGPKLWDTIRHPLQHIGKSGKIMAGSAAALVMGYQIVKGKLEANQKTAVIDHKLKTGHRN